MESTQQTINRLLGALETLTREEHLLLDHGQFNEAIEVQSREQPLVARIIELLVQPGVASGLETNVQQRAQRLLNAQREQSQRLELSINEVRDHLDQLRAAQNRAQKLRPSYGSPADAPALSFAGEA
jgi:hypothetical protein